MTAFEHSRIVKELLLKDGSRIVLLDMLAAPASFGEEEVNRNLFRVSADGGIIWRITAPPGVYSRCPFTGVNWTESQGIVAYRWDGTEFLVEAQTGIATPARLTK